MKKYAELTVLERSMVEQLPTFNKALRPVAGELGILDRDLTLQDLKLIMKYKLTIFVDICDQRGNLKSKYPEVVDLILKSDATKTVKSSETAVAEDEEVLVTSHFQ